ncbi:hypothetical protein ZIOFF_070747 [Zingiber officinale]|uniref:CpSecY n=1 Tax=Zingiber officinale TaxID=94328 RepID=A0A8J5ETA2_ZINOF|nr:hypothetical protein ZIOFF_070747 [Zingiber officinale]
MPLEVATSTFVPETQLSDRESPIEMVNLEKTVLNAEDTRKHSSWTKVKDEVLVTISDDPIIDNDQKADAFWGRVAIYYNEDLPLDSNTRSANVIRDEDILRFAYEKYLSENNGVPFNLEHVWRIVKDHPMFTPQSADHFVATKKTRTSESGASNTSSNQDVSIDLDYENTRPMRQKAAKRKGKYKVKSTMEDLTVNYNNIITKFTEYTSVKKSEVELKQKATRSNSSSSSSSTSEDEVHVEIDEQTYDLGEEMMLLVLQQHQQLMEAYQRRDTLRRRPNADDVQRLLQMHDERHGFPGMLDQIYPEWATFVKAFPCPKDLKRKLFKERQKYARKDVEWAFGVLQSRWTIVRGPAQYWCRKKLKQIMLACIILHNMIVEDEGEHVTNWYNEKGDEPAQPIHGSNRGFQDYLRINSELRDTQVHHQLRADLVEHIWGQYNNNPRCRSISTMLLSARQPQSSAPHGLVFSGFYSAPPRRTSLALSRPSVVLCRASYSAAVNTEIGRGSSAWDDLRLSSDGGTSFDFDRRAWEQEQELYQMLFASISHVELDLDVKFTTVLSESKVKLKCIKQSDLSNFDPLGLYKERTLGLGSFRENVLDFFSQTFESTSSPKKDRSALKRGAAAAIEDSSIDIGDFFKGPLPGKFLKLLGYLALSRLGVYVPLGGVNREAFAGNLDQNSLLSTLDSFSGGGIGRLGICSLGIVPFINAQIVFQLLTQIYPKLQDLQKREGEAGRKKVLQYTRYASVGFAVVQVREILFSEAFGFGIPDLVSYGAMLNCSIATKEIKAIGQVLFLRPYVNDFSTEWAVSSIVLLTLGSVFTTYIGERISDLKLGNGTSLLIFTSIISYLPASFGRTVAQAFQDGNYLGLAAIIFSFFLLVLGIVYVQEAERKIPLNYASRYTTGGLQKSAYLPFKVFYSFCSSVHSALTVNSSGVMPIIFSTSSLALPGTLARFTGVTALKKAALALNPGGSLYLPTNILLIAFFNYYYTFLQLDPDDVSEQLKRQGASVPLIRPGKSTSAFLKTVLSRISVLGSAFLAVLAAGPSVIEQTTRLTAFRGFAGTSVLILVGCATDTARKVQAEIISQKYKNIEFYDINQ